MLHGRGGHGLCDQCVKKYDDRPAHILEVLVDGEWRTLTEIQSLVKDKFQDEIPLGSLYGNLQTLIEKLKVHRSGNCYFLKEKV